MPSSLLDEAFSLLDQANALELQASKSNSCTSNEAAGEGSSSSTESLDYGSLLQQASSKYHEACYLMKRHVGRNNVEKSGDAERMRSLMVEKIEHYEHHAEELMKRVKEHRAEVARYPGFALERNVSPNSSWENNHASQIEPARSKVSDQNAKHVERLRETTNEAAVQVASKASAMLSTAIKLDESGENSKATEQYLAAAQLYLDAVRLLSEDNNANVDLVTSLKHKVQLALDRAEELKKRKKIDCDEVNRKLALLTSRQDLPYSANKEKPDCEEINKKLASLKPIHRESLSPTEIEVLKRSSLLTSGLFLPWCDEEAKTYNYFAHSSPWLDPDGLLALSEKQTERFYKWARPSEIIQMTRHSSREIKMLNSVTPFTIKQYCVSDCSFIAGLCIAASHERRFNNRIISSLIYPQDESGNPIYNPSGVYMVKLWLNGVARRVLVDDLLPVDKKGRLLCSHTDSRLNRSKRNLNTRGSGPLELWVPILEKAYMKLCGGYDFPGSNSGIDLFSLTGWIPERIFFPADETNVKDFETPVERVWERVYSASAYGDCLITLSTHNLTEEKAAEVGLFTAHAYAVLEVIQTTNGTRLLQLKNPWASEGWKGRYSSCDTIWSNPEFCAEVGYGAISAMTNEDDGVFYISWDDVIKYCSNFHLSWNPSLFRHKTSMHGMWRKEEGPLDDSFNVGENPQYSVTLSQHAIASRATLWILLSRHVTKQEQEGGDVSDFLTLHIHRSKDRIWYPQGSVLEGAYTNNTHVLIRYDVEGLADKYLALVLSQFKKSNDLCYTLSCYCTEKFRLNQKDGPLPHCQILDDSWTLRGSSSSSLLHVGTAGGPIGKGSFGSNPQWSLLVSSDTKIQCKCMANKSLAINVILVQTGSEVPSSGHKPKSKRIHHIYETPVVDSGDYRYGFTVTKQTTLPAGLYTLIASTYEVGKEGRFVVHVMSDRKIGINEIT